MKIIEKIHWPFYLGWVFSGVIGFVIAFPFSWVLDVFVIDEIIGQTIIVNGKVHITEDYIGWYILIPLFGIAIGIFQYLLLRQKLTKMGWWILITTFGWSLAWLGFSLRHTPLSDVEIPPSVGYSLMLGAILGILIGAFQWLILRTQVSHAGWWIPINALGFGIAGIVFLNDTYGMFDILAGITIPHIGTGIALWLLLEKFRNENNAIRPDHAVGVDGVHP